MRSLPTIPPDPTADASLLWVRKSIVYATCPARLRHGIYGQPPSPVRPLLAAGDQIHLYLYQYLIHLSIKVNIPSFYYFREPATLA